EQQRAKADAGIARIREPADDELTLLHAFDLEPVRGAPASIARRAPLRHDALEAELAYLVEQGLALPFEMVDIADRPAMIEDTPARQEVAEQLLARLEPHVRQIVPVEIDEIEDFVDQPGRAIGGQRLLQLTKAAGAVRLQRHELAVDHRPFDAEVRERFHQRREARGPVLAVAAEETDGPALDTRDQPVAVELDLVQPAV